MSDTIPPEIVQDTTAPEKMAEVPYVAMGYCPPSPRPAHVLPNAPRKDAIHGDPRARAFQKRKKCLSRPHQAHARPPCLNKALLICTLTSLISVISPPRDQPAPIPPPRSTVTRLEDK